MRTDASRPGLWLAFSAATLLTSVAWGQSTSDRTSLTVEDEGSASEPSPDQASPSAPDAPGPPSPDPTEEELAEEIRDTSAQPEQIGTPGATNVDNTADETNTADRTDPADENQVDEATEKDPYAKYDQTGTPPPPPMEDDQQEKDEANDSDKKWDKDYDGVRDRTRPEDALVWLIRAPLYPVHFLLNYGVRHPTVFLMTKAEEHKVFQRVQDLLTFADGKAGIYPLAFYDAGRGFWGGLNFYYNDLGVENHNIRATAGIGTNNWIQARIKDSFRIFDNDSGQVTFAATFLRNPTFSYTGMGPDTDISDQVFFGEEKLELSADLEVAMQGLNRFTMRFDVRRAELEGGRDPSIDDPDSPFDTDGLTGFETHFTLARFGMKLDLDTRKPKNDFLPGSGLRFETWGAYNYGFGEPELNFVRYGLHPQVIFDMTGANHVLKLGLYAEGVSRTGGDPIPLNELVALGGNEHMRGFLPGRFRGQSALVYNLDYSWPLLSFADAIFFTEVGNAYNGFFDDFTHENMALDWGVGLRSSFSRELSVVFAVGFGTNQFDTWQADGFHVDKTRFLVGATHHL